MIERAHRTSSRSSALRGRFASIVELHQRLDDLDVATASRETLLDAVAGYELVRVHAVHRQRQARARLGQGGADDC